jgi:choline dehydrogenase
MELMAELPSHADVVIVGGGTAGAAVAARLAERSDTSVLVLEAGPDYGPFAGGGWPASLLDATRIPEPHHDWEYVSTSQHGAPRHRLDRARVLGGCSAHNGCAAIWGSRLDYDGWERRGNPGWSTASLLPIFVAASERMGVRIPAMTELTPWQRVCLEAAPKVGIPIVADLNDLDQDTGMAPSPANIRDGVRWNTAFAYLDPARSRPNLQIAGGLLVDRIRVAGGHAIGVDVLTNQGVAQIHCALVVLSAGSYGSPAILLRSGLGPPEELRELGIEPLQALPGVGANLHDHPSTSVRFTGSGAMREAMQRFTSEHWCPEEQTIAKARSRRCTDGFDLHLYPVGGRRGAGDGAWCFELTAAVMTPRSRGRLRLKSADPTVAPLIDTGYLTDAEGNDLETLLDGVELAREFAAQTSLGALAGEELLPGPHPRGRDELGRYLLAHSLHYYHPVGACAMGPESDPQSVVDARGRLHGVDNLYVADASIMPVIPRANTNLPTLVVGERIAELLLESA